MSNIFSENDVYIMWTSKKPNKGWSNPRDEKGRFTKKQPFGPVTVDLKYLQSLEKRIERLEKANELKE